MHGRDAVPLGTLAIAAALAALGIWMAEFIIPSFSGPPWQTVVAIIGVAVVVGVVGKPSSQLDTRPVPLSSEPDPQPRRPLRNVAAGGHDALAGSAAAQPAFQPLNIANAVHVGADRTSDRKAPL